MSQILIREFTLINDLGLHARAATVFVRATSQFESEVFVSKDGREVNGKSILGLLTLVASRGSQIEVRVEGDDAQAVLTAIEKIIQNRFGEPR